MCTCTSIEFLASNAAALKHVDVCPSSMQCTEQGLVRRHVKILGPLPWIRYGRLRRVEEITQQLGLKVSPCGHSNNHQMSTFSNEKDSETDKLDVHAV